MRSLRRSSLLLGLGLTLGGCVPDARELRPGSAACLEAAQTLAFTESLAAGQGFVRVIAAYYARLLGERIALHCVALNQVQVLGSHNSYHVEARPELMQVLLLFSSEFLKVQYSHPPLDQQFESQGIRQIELDVFTDPQGGLYALRRGLLVISQDPHAPDPVMLQPGSKVLHIQDVDFESNCLSYDRCLRVVKAWSDTHRNHLPIAILTELKQDPIPDPLGLGFTVPLPYAASDLDEIDREIRSVFPSSQLITPDDVRGSHATLEEAVLIDGWPSLADARGKVLFLMDNRGSFRELYRQGRPSLEGRVLFTNATPGDPDAAFVEVNDPLADPTLIPSLVKQGYVVRTRSDADTLEARTGDTVARDAALASGAQWVSTDYPVPDPRFGTGFLVEIPDGQPGRCNPVNAPPGCRNASLEDGPG